MKLLIIFLLFATKSCFASSKKSSEAESYEPAHFKFVRKNYADYKDLKKNSCFSKIHESKYFNRSLPSVLIIHGVEMDYKSEYSKTLVDAFVFRKEHNVIFGDWSAYAFDDYSDMAHEVDHIADVFVEILNKMRDNKYDLTKLYIIGHSLGAHIAGRIGRILQHQNIIIPRITGLDPTGSLYNHASCWKHWVKFMGSYHKPLSKDDAKFVDIIHSNAGLYKGIVFSSGHLDFWPNCGVFQPHCDECKLPKIFTDFHDCSQCSHVASWNYYVESVYSNIPIFEAKRCDTKILMKFFCNGDKAFMGYYASSDADHGDYYVETNDHSPYSK
ncbi:lipoprotein lipase-like [Chironomus tepperi]|uniref:lipoprotein lipase-like n=1 Tax=Chironomus tepperi TaxID=113505 RepID=UPI00391F4357